MRSCRCVGRAAGADIIGRLSEAGIRCGYVGRGRYFTSKDLRRFVWGQF